jgi:hypothetical protein
MAKIRGEDGLHGPSRIQVEIKVDRDWNRADACNDLCGALHLPIRIRIGLLVGGTQLF